MKGGEDGPEWNEVQLSAISGSVDTRPGVSHRKHGVVLERSQRQSGDNQESPSEACSIILLDCRGVTHTTPCPSWSFTLRQPRLRMTIDPRSFAQASLPTKVSCITA